MDDLFHIGVFLSEDDYYTEYLSEEVDEEDCPEDYPRDDYKAQDKYIADLQEKILKGEINKPEWMKSAEKGTNYCDYEYSTSLHILPKDEKYTELVKKMITFLNYPWCEATRDG